MLANGPIQISKFSDVDINDSFFKSLSEAYVGFDDWFRRKGNEEAYVMYQEDGTLQAFLYLKIEEGAVTDINPPLNTRRCLKVGTFKVEAHGTRLGERFVKKIFDHAIFYKVDKIYVTVFPKHEPLIRILERYGFDFYGTKTSASGTENVYVKRLDEVTGDPLHDYPVVDARDNNKWMLSIWKDFHSNMFPDSILKNEDASIIGDVSFSNSIHKTYVGFLSDMRHMKVGDNIVMYLAMGREKTRAWYTSVATSLCTIQDIRPKRSFKDEDEFVKYCQKGSVFDEGRLRWLYNQRKYYELHALTMTYNTAFPKRPNLKALVEDAKLPDPKSTYYGLVKLTDDQFSNILKLGNVYEGLVID